MPCGVIGDILAARGEGTGETALRGLCQLSIHNKYVPRRSFHYLTILIIFPFTVLSLHPFVHSFDPPCRYFHFLSSIENFYFLATSFPRTTPLSNHFSPY